MVRVDPRYKRRILALTVDLRTEIELQKEKENAVIMYVLYDRFVIFFCTDTITTPRDERKVVRETSRLDKDRHPLPPKRTVHIHSPSEDDEVDTRSSRCNDRRGVRERSTDHVCSATTTVRLFQVKKDKINCPLSETETYHRHHLHRTRVHC